MSHLVLVDRAHGAMGGGLGLVAFDCALPVVGRTSRAAETKPGPQFLVNGCEWWLSGLGLR
ncbi:MAG: hypothetical protein IT353_15855 [Gemmatimonadaceae bacterium]|nr:hypothetical protein [Gemmatimonadaceae bacterium]